MTAENDPNDQPAEQLTEPPSDPPPETQGMPEDPLAAILARRLAQAEAAAKEAISEAEKGPVTRSVTRPDNLVPSREQLLDDLPSIEVGRAEDEAGGGAPAEAPGPPPRIEALKTTRTPALPTGKTKAILPRSTEEKPEGVGRVFGPYHLKRRLASGGLSAVFLGVDTRTDTEVAVKVFKPEVSRNPELVWLAERSLAVTRQLTHHNLVRILDGGVLGDRRYSVMEYLQGRTLAQELAEGPLGFRPGMGVLRQILEAIDVIHSAGMAHRDLKPSNILLIPTDKGFDVKILDLDFMGPIEHQRLAQVRELLGTPKYMAPEEIHRGFPHQRSDLFSIGVLAYEMFSGHEPFRVEKEVGYLYANRFENPTPLRELKKDLPPELDQFINALLARQPGERHDARSALRDCRALEFAATQGPGAAIRLAGPPRAQRGSWQLVVLVLLASMLPIIGLLLWATSRRQLEAMPVLDLPVGIAALPKPTKIEPRPDVPPEWPRLESVIVGRDRLTWEQARRAVSRAALPIHREEARQLLSEICNNVDHPYQTVAARLLSRLEEEEYLRLREDRPETARSHLEQALGLAVDPNRKAQLGDQLRELDKRIRDRQVAESRPKGFVVVTGRPPTFVAKAPISNLDYLAYLRVRPNAPRPPGWTNSGLFQLGAAHRPVTGLSSETVIRYAGWRQARLVRSLELKKVEGQLTRGGPEWVVDPTRGLVLSGGSGAAAEKAAVFRLALDAGKKLRPVDQPTPAHLVTIDSQPDQAKVTINGRAVGKTPVVLPFYTSGMIEVVVQRGTRLPGVEYLELQDRKMTLVLSLFDATVIPRKLRDYAENKASAYKLLEEAESRMGRRQTQLARTLFMLVYREYPRNWMVAKSLLRNYEREARPALKSNLQKALQKLNGEIDKLRKARYNGDIDDIWPSLEQRGYPRQAEMSRIPAGTFKSGAENRRPGELKVSTRTLKAYWIDRREVSNRKYQRFVISTGYLPVPKHWENGRCPVALLDHPVVNVAFADAEAFAKWVGKRLPTEDEWVKAARGSRYRRYPWGKHFETKLANTKEYRKERATMAVGTFGRGKSPYGLLDLCGNVSEWTVTPYDPGSAFTDKVNTLKGGSFRYGRSDCRIAARRPLRPGERADDVGFRCVSDAK